MTEWEDIAPALYAQMHGDPETVRVALEQGRAWIWRCADGFAVMATQIDDFGVRELFVWVVVGRNALAHLDELRAVARENGCRRIVAQVARDGLLRMLQRAGWTPRAVELTTEV